MVGILPAPFRGLPDEEIEQHLFEELRMDGRVELEELDITVQNGKVILEGRLPSEVKHQILLEVIEDRLGFIEVEDYIDIDELLWEKRASDSGSGGEEKSEEEVTLYGEDTRQEMQSALKDGKPSEAPDKLVSRYRIF